MAKKSIYSVGGTVQASGGLYIPRKADEELLSLCGDSVFAYVLTSRQMGKSSLMVNTARQLEAEGIHPVIIDLTQIGVQVTTEEWYLGLLDIIEDSLMLQTDMHSWWEDHAHLGFTQRLTTFFEEVLLAEVEGPVVIFIDEIDSTLSLDFTDDFYAAIRYIYNARASVPEFRRLSFVLIGVATPNDLISDPNRTPFNIGRRVDLTDFTPQEAMPLADGLGPPDNARQVLGWVMKWTRGHPYLTQRLCREIANQDGYSWSEADVDRTVADTFFGEKSEQDSNLQFVRDMLTERVPDPTDVTDVLDTYREIRRGRHPVIDEEQSLVKSHLKLSGVVRQENGELRVRNSIYQEVFDLRWVKEHWPVHWLVHWLKLTPRRLVNLVIAAVIFVLAFFSVYSYYQKIQADIAKAEAVEQREKAEQAKLEAEAQRQLAREQAGIAEERRKEAEVAETEADIQRQRAEVQAEIAKDRREEAEVAKAAEAEQREKAEAAAREAEMRRKEAEVARAAEAEQRKKAEAAAREAEMRRKEAEVAKAAEAEQRKKAEAAAREAEERRKEAEVAKELEREQRQIILARNLATQADLARNLSSELRVLLAAESVNRFPSSFENVQVLRERLVESADATAACMEHDSYLYSAVFSPDGRYLATAGNDNTARVWDTFSGEEVARIKHETYLNSVAFSPDGRYLAIAVNDNTAQVWDVFSGKRVARMKHESGVSSVCFSPDGRYLATTGNDKAARVWVVSDGSRVARMNHESSVNSVAFSSDGRYLATASDDGSAKIWEVSTGKGNNGTSIKHNGSVFSVAFSPDGRYLATADDNRTAHIWEVSTREEVARMVHDGPVYSVAFSPDSGYLATASKDMTARIWEVPSGQPVAQMKHQDEVYSVCFSPDSSYLATASRDRIARIWLLLPDDLMSKARAYVRRNFTQEEWVRYLGDEEYRKTWSDLPGPGD